MSRGEMADQIVAALLAEHEALYACCASEGAWEPVAQAQHNVHGLLRSMLGLAPIERGAPVLRDELLALRTAIAEFHKSAPSPAGDKP